MENKPTYQGFINLLENLEDYRYTKIELETIINDYLNKDGMNILITLKYGTKKDSDDIFNIIFDTKNELNEVNCCFNIYVIPTNAIINNNIIYYITGVDYPSKLS